MTSYTFADPPPYDHQKRILKRIIETKGVCAILADPGTGKTRTVIDYAGMLATKAQAEVRVLVIPPLAAIDGWVEQSLDYLPDGIGLWAEAVGGSIEQRAEAIRSRGPDTGGNRLTGFRRAEMLALRTVDGERSDPRDGPEALGEPRVVMLSTNLDGFASRRAVTPGGTVTAADRMVRGVEGFQPHLVVIDESHRIKGHSSNTSRTIARIRKHAPRRLILTGTVMPHSPLDVYGQWRFLAPDVFATKHADGSGEKRAWSFYQFRDRYAKMGGYLGKEVKGFRNLDEMQDKMAENSVVVRKEDALDLPPTQDARISVSLSPKERKAYAQMKQDLVTKMDDGSLTSAPNVLAQLMKLRQITSGILHDDESGEPIDLGDSKVKAIASHVNDSLGGEERVVIFAHFRDEIARIADAVSGKGTYVATITGDTKAGDRTKIRKEFGALKRIEKDDGTVEFVPDDSVRHDGRMVLVAQVRTMSLAVNELVAANHAVYGSLSERRDDYVQSRDRLDRIGQTKPVTFWHAVVPGTVDEVILEAHRDRTNLEDAVLSHLKGE